ncbi:MAG TPA: MBL fold metallo-hydrolase [Prolixibacteraceae bacterium]|nr:MBL fold metallo-hydrolase [Prolixibacteraceae bacterium]HPR59792.1 MBL fold metallo-hydrolase [Prolixibacteraceae bacterium]
MVEVCALASGSNGNCYYIGNENEAILVDAGISCKQILQRMNNRELDTTKLKAVFITHEHADHVRGARVLSKKLNLPIFYTYGTWNNTHKSSRSPYYKFIHIDQALTLGAFTIHAFAKNHDAGEPCSYRIEIENKSVGVMTDIGSVCNNVIEHLQKCNVVFLESNYDEQMLWDGPYPWHLKKRIASDVGHLSNLQALNLVNTYANGELKTIFLSHLSGENNTPAIASNAFKPLNEKYKIIETSRHEASVIFSF